MPGRDVHLPRDSKNLIPKQLSNSVLRIDAWLGFSFLSKLCMTMRTDLLAQCAWGRGFSL